MKSVIPKRSARFRFTHVTICTEALRPCLSMLLAREPYATHDQCHLDCTLIEALVGMSVHGFVVGAGREPLLA